VDDVRAILIEIADDVVGSPGRVDVVTAKVMQDGIGMRVVVEASSGWNSREYQDETAVDMVSEFAKTFWTAGGLGNIYDGLGVDFDLTMDGRSWIIPAQTMVDISNRRTSAASALGL